MVEYFVDNAGSDAASGLYGAPWATPAQVSVKIADGTVKRGDSVRFSRGQVFYGRLDSTTLSTTGTTQLEIGAVGNGVAPQINGYKVSLNSWTLESAGVWKLDLTAASGQYTGNTTSTNTDVGHLREGQMFHGRKRSTLAALSADWDFFSDATFLYVKKATSPGEGVRIAVRQSGHSTGSYTTTSGLHLLGHGAHGVSASDRNQVNVTGCTIEAVGGSYVSGTTRYGNGIEGFMNARNWTITGNHIMQTYDVGFTLQGAMSAGGTRDVLFAHNFVEHCNQSVEFWATNATPGAASFSRIRVMENIFISAGDSWGAVVRDDATGKGIHVLTYDMEGTADILITRNVFHGAKDAFAWYRTAPPAGVTVTDNSIYLTDGTKITWQDTQTIGSPGSNPYAVGSRLFALPADAAEDVLRSIAAQAAFATEIARYWRAVDVAA